MALAHKMDKKTKHALEKLEQKKRTKEAIVSAGQTRSNGENGGIIQ